MSIGWKATVKAPIVEERIVIKVDFGGMSKEEQEEMKREMDEDLLGFLERYGNE